MRVRRIAVLIDGGFFERRAAALLPERTQSAEDLADLAVEICRAHVEQIARLSIESGQIGWLDHVYRLFYYDASPYSKAHHNPISNKREDYSKSNTAIFHNSLHKLLLSKRKFAVRLGKVTAKERWSIDDRHTKGLPKTRSYMQRLAAFVADNPTGTALPDDLSIEAISLNEKWASLTPDSVNLGLKQKGVDMRIGVDISSISLKKLADTIILITGDSDFVPAAKLARREGVEFLIDPMGQNINEDLLEHVDGIQNGLRPHRSDDETSPLLKLFRRNATNIRK